MSDLQPGRPDRGLQRPRRALVPTRPLESIAVDIDGTGGREPWASVYGWGEAVRQHKRAVILITCLGALGGLVATLVERPVYRAGASIEIRVPGGEDLLSPRGAAAAGTRAKPLYADIQTQVKILQSKALNQVVLAKVEALPRPDDLQSSHRLGVVRRMLSLGPAQDADLWSRGIRTAADGVRVRASGTDHIIDISCDSTLPQMAASFCNALTAAFIDQNLAARSQSTEYAGQWLQTELQALHHKLEKQESELQAFAKITGRVLDDDKPDVDQTRLSDLQKELFIAQADRLAKQSTRDTSAAGSAPGALAEVLDEAALKDSQKSLSTLEARLAQLDVTLTPNNPEVKRVEAQITAVKASLAAAKASAASRIRDDFEAAVRRETLLSDAYARQSGLVSGKSADLARYHALKRDVDATHRLHDTLQQRLEEAGFASALRASNIRVVDAAVPPLAPFKPDLGQRLLVGTLSGLLCGMVVAAARTRVPRTHDPDDDMSYFLAVSELGAPGFVYPDATDDAHGGDTVAGHIDRAEGVATANDIAVDNLGFSPDGDIVASIVDLRAARSEAIERWIEARRHAPPDTPAG